MNLVEIRILWTISDISADFYLAVWYDIIIHIYICAEEILSDFIIWW